MTPSCMHIYWSTFVRHQPDSTAPTHDIHIASYQWVHHWTFDLFGPSSHHYSNQCFTLPLRFITQCDGLICTSSSVYERESIDALRKWLAESGNRELYTIGQLVPPALGALVWDFLTVPNPSENGSDCQVFMDKIFGVHGEQSLIYVSRSSLLFLSSCWSPMLKRLQGFFS